MGFEIGENVGDYRITGVLGAGGYGEVYRAEHTITKRVEALKMLAPGRSHSGEEEQRFLREIQLHASLAHPNIASVHNAFSTRQGLVLVMELVEGEPLDAILRRGRIPLETGIDYILQVLSALGHAHANAVLHRDVKPGNIVIAPAGTVKLTDFGLARQTQQPALTQSGTPAGSPYYMSPEQIHGVGPVDARSDLYSTGAVLYEIATGTRPFEGESAFDVMQAHVERAPVPPVEIRPAIGHALNQVILTALAKEPSGRFQSAAEFRDALEAARRDLKLAPPARTRRSWRPLGLLRAKTVWAAAAALALGAVILAGVMRSGSQPPVRVAPQPSPKPQPVAVQPAAPVPAPPLPVANEQPQPVEETPTVAPPAAPAVTEEASSSPLKPAARKARRTHTATASRREPPAVEQPVAARAEEPPRIVVSTPPPHPGSTATPDPKPPVPVAAVPAPPPEEASAEAAPKKHGNRVWRALGRIARPWKSSKKPETEGTEEPQ